MKFKVGNVLVNEETREELVVQNIVQDKFYLVMKQVGETIAGPVFAGQLYSEEQLDKFSVKKCDLGIDGLCDNEDKEAAFVSQPCSYCRTMRMAKKLNN